MQIRQVAQHVHDLDRAATFYARLLDRAPVARFDPPGLVFFEVDGIRLLLEVGAPRSLLYWGVDQIASTLERLGSDVTLVSAAHEIFRHTDDTLGPAGHREFHAFIEDSEGNTVGLVEWQRIPSF